MTPSSKLNKFKFLQGVAQEVAPRLLGCELVRTINGHTLRGRIVETEAYDQTDAASHSYRGQTPRTEIMFGPAGRLYVYFTYGMHYCCNVVVGDEGRGAAVLIRALEPLEGQIPMSESRQKPQSSILLTNGPGKLCQAMQISRRLNGSNLMEEESEVRLVTHDSLRDEEIIRTTRVGITQAMDVPWRFYIKGNPYISRR